MADPMRWPPIGGAIRSVLQLPTSAAFPQNSDVKLDAQALYTVGSPKVGVVYKSRRASFTKADGVGGLGLAPADPLISPRSPAVAQHSPAATHCDPERPRRQAEDVPRNKNPGRFGPGRFVIVDREFLQAQ
jgi:hypothetical protein